MIPTVAKESLRDANLVAGALEVTGIATQSLVVAVGTVGGSIADETFLNALASVAAKNSIKLKNV